MFHNRSKRRVRFRHPLWVELFQIQFEGGLISCIGVDGFQFTLYIHHFSDITRTQPLSLRGSEHSYWCIPPGSSTRQNRQRRTEDNWESEWQSGLPSEFPGGPELRRFVHHTNKSGTQRGTSGREDSIDISISLVHPGTYSIQDGARFVIHFNKARLTNTDLKLISDMEFRLVENEGKLAWTWESVKNTSKVEVLKLLGEGHSQKEIADRLRMSKGQVSKNRPGLG